MAAFLGRGRADDCVEDVSYFGDVPEGISATADAAFTVLAKVYAAIGDEGEEGLRYRTAYDLRNAAASVTEAVERYLADIEASDRRSR